MLSPQYRQCWEHMVYTTCRVQTAWSTTPTMFRMHGLHCLPCPDSMVNNTKHNHTLHVMFRLNCLQHRPFSDCLSILLSLSDIISFIHGMMYISIYQVFSNFLPEMTTTFEIIWKVTWLKCNDPYHVSIFWP